MNEFLKHNVNTKSSWKQSLTVLFFYNVQFNFPYINDQIQAVREALDSSFEIKFPSDLYRDIIPFLSAPTEIIPENEFLTLSECDCGSMRSSILYQMYSILQNNDRKENQNPMRIEYQHTYVNQYCRLLVLC
eukprot:UN25879